MILDTIRRKKKIPFYILEQNVFFYPAQMLPYIILFAQALNASDKGHNLELKRPGQRKQIFNYLLSSNLLYNYHTKLKFVLWLSSVWSLTESVRTCTELYVDSFWGELGLSCVLQGRLMFDPTLYGSQLKKKTKQTNKQTNKS